MDSLVSTQWLASELGASDLRIVDASAYLPEHGRDPLLEYEACHIPGARNVYYASLFRPDGTWKSPADIRAVFEAAGVDLARPLIASCGSGMTANVLIFAAHLIGKDDVALYDGSWTEWGADPETPKETGAAA